MGGGVDIHAHCAGGGSEGTESQSRPCFRTGLRAPSTDQESVQAVLNRLSSYHHGQIVSSGKSPTFSTTSL